MGHRRFCVGSGMLFSLLAPVLSQGDIDGIGESADTAMAIGVPVTRLAFESLAPDTGRH